MGAAMDSQCSGKQCSLKHYDFDEQHYKACCNIIKLKDRITPHVTNFFRLRLTIEEQEGKRKYKSDGAVMVGEFCVYVCMFMYSE